MYNIINGMARAMWVMAWADELEERGHEDSWAGCDLMDLAPETPCKAIELAWTLAGKYEQANGMSVICLLGSAQRADGNSTNDYEYETDFGHYLAMMAMGHGVSWFDDHEEFYLKVPSIDNYSLRSIV